MYIFRKYIRGRMHVSWFIMWGSFGILIGSLAGPSNADINSLLWIFIACILLFNALSFRYRYLFVLALSAGMIIGLCRASNQYIDLQAYDLFRNEEIALLGRVAEDVSIGSKGDQRFQITNVSVGQKDLPGKVWISTADTRTIRRGDFIVVQGKLGEGFGTISASMFRAKIASLTYTDNSDPGREARDRFGVGVKNAIPDDNAEFALAYLVGQKLTMSETLNDQLKTIGLVHAVVASGAHLTILVGAVRRLFVRVSKYLTTVASFGMIGGFILVTGFSPSMTRAGLVSGISLLAWYYGRVVHPLVLLPFVAAVTVLYNPSYIWGDVGWYLSFSAFAGVIILAPLLHHYFWGDDKSPGLLREVLVATVAAQLTTLPIVIAAFGYYSPYALLANLLVVPLVPITMLLTFITGILGLIFMPIARIVGTPLNLILDYMKIVVEWLATAPGAQKEVTIGWQMIIAAYIGIIAMSIYLLKVTGHKFRRDTKIQKEF